MSDNTETIYLIPGEDADGLLCWVWCRRVVSSGL